MSRVITITKIAVAFIGGIVLIFALWYCNMFVISPLDRPWIISKDEETITLAYVNWACDCADFVEIRHFQNSAVSEPKSEDYIFIEPSRPDLRLDSDFYSDKHFYSYIKLTGKFYFDKGIPESYELKTPQKPEHAKVFRYDKIEFIDKAGGN